MKGTCELCKAMARIHCDCDEASLCWDCDAKVHSANFLVARHSRNLLCRVCQSPTSWSASGSKLERIFSVCRKCVNRGIRKEEGEEETVEDEVAEEVEENHIVPWSPPPPESYSSSSGEEPVSGGEEVVSRKRRNLADEDRDGLSSHRDIHTSPSSVVTTAAEYTPGRTSTPPPKIRITDPGKVGVSESGVLESLRRFHREEKDLDAKMPELLTLSGGPRTIDLNLSEAG